LLNHITPSFIREMPGLAREVFGNPLSTVEASIKSKAVAIERQGSALVLGLPNLRDSSPSSTIEEQFSKPGNLSPGHVLVKFQV
jgi:molybdopterin biosynthesis enzyme MoaB